MARVVLSAAGGMTNPMSTVQDLIVGGASGNPARLGVGANGQVLTVTAGVVGWANAASGFSNPMTTAQDLIVAGAGGTAQRLGIGSNGQVLTIVGGNVQWSSASMVNPMTTNQDIVVGGSAGAPARLGIGSNGQVLTVTSGLVTWANSASGFANPMTTVGDLIVATTGGAAQRLAAGSSGQVLTISGGLPTWAASTGGGGTPTIVSPGNLGATYTLTLSSTETWLIGTLNANNALTIGGLTSGYWGRLLLSQDATGGRTLSVNGTSVPIASTASAFIPIIFEYDGTNLYVTVEGGAATGGGGGGAVSSVFTRTGAVVAASGDYTAAQVTNAADKSSGSQQAFTGEVKAPDFTPAGLTGATTASRYVGGTISGAPASGTFVVGDWVVDQSGKRWTCTTAGTPGTWTQEPGTGSGAVSSVFTRTGAVVATSGDYTAAQVTNAADKSSASQQAFTGEVKAPDFSTSGLTGATAAGRYVGNTTAGAPASGTFLKGDWVSDQNGKRWTCTTAGTPGTWTQEPGVVSSVFGRTGAVVSGSGDYTAAQVTNAADKSSASAQAFTGEVGAPDFNPSGLTGATAAGRYVGHTTSGAPVSGTFLKGDWVSDQNGKRWTCTTAGTPGTWTQEPGTGFVNPMTATGDVIVGGTSGAPQRLAVGANGQVLTVSGGTEAWTTPPYAGALANPANLPIQYPGVGHGIAVAGEGDYLVRGANVRPGAGSYFESGFDINMLNTELQQMVNYGFNTVRFLGTYNGYLSVPTTYATNFGLALQAAVNHGLRVLFCFISWDTDNIGSALTSSYTAGSATMNVTDTTGFPSTGSITFTHPSGTFSGTVAYTGKTATTVTGCSGGTGTANLTSVATVSNTNPVSAMSSLYTGMFDTLLATGPASNNNTWAGHPNILGWETIEEIAGSLSGDSLTLVQNLFNHFRTGTVTGNTTAGSTSVTSLAAGTTSVPSSGTTIGVSSPGNVATGGTTINITGTTTGTLSSPALATTTGATLTIGLDPVSPITGNPGAFNTKNPADYGASIATWDPYVDFHSPHIYPDSTDNNQLTYYFGLDFLSCVRANTAKPILIGESGNSALSTDAAYVGTEERKAAFARWLRRYAATPQTMGACYWQWWDQSTAGYGLFDSSGNPHQALSEWILLDRRSAAAAWDMVERRSTPIAIDDFNRAASTTVVGTSPLGGTPSQSGLTWGINASQQLYIPSTTGTGFLTWQCNTGDVDLELDFVVPTGTYNVGLVARFQSSTNYYRAVVVDTTSPRIVLSSVVAGVTTALGTYTGGGPTSGKKLQSRLRFCLRRAYLVVYEGDTERLAIKDTSFDATNTTHGIFMNSSGTQDTGTVINQFKASIPVRYGP